MRHSFLPSRICGAVRAIGLRVALWGGLTLVALAWLGYLPSFLPRPAGVQEPNATPETAQVETPPGPGWPHLRGPRYNAHSDETGLADSWPPEGPPVLWTQELGSGYSALVAVGNQVYTQRQTLADQSVVCLDADTGELVWEHSYGWPYEPGGMYPGPRATPTYGDGLLVFAAPDGLVGCLRAADGRRMWAVNVKEKFRGRGTEFGYACSPLLEDGKVIVPAGGPEASVVALDLRDGSPVWTSGIAPASYCSALPITFGGRLYLRSPTRAACIYVGRPEGLTPEQLARAQPLFAIPKARAINVTWLVGGEREHPYDAPDLRELTRWYLFSLGCVLLPATAIAAVTAGLVRVRWRVLSRPVGWTVFWLLAVVLGMAATPFGNRFSAAFVFTWPVALFAAQQVALMAILHARQRPERRTSAGLSAAAVALLVVASLAYYSLCRRVTLAVNWVFLMGFLPSWPLAIPAARSLLRNRRPWLVLLWTLLAFSLYFWASAGFIFGKAWLTQPEY